MPQVGPQSSGAARKACAFLFQADLRHYSPLQVLTGGQHNLVQACGNRSKAHGLVFRATYGAATPHRSVAARKAHLSHNGLHRCAQFSVDVDAWTAHNIAE